MITEAEIQKITALLKATFPDRIIVATTPDVALTEVSEKN